MKFSCRGRVSDGLVRFPPVCCFTACVPKVDSSLGLLRCCRAGFMQGRLRCPKIGRNCAKLPQTGVAYLPSTGLGLRICKYSGSGKYPLGGRGAAALPPYLCCSGIRFMHPVTAFLTCDDVQSCRLRRRHLAGIKIVSHRKAAIIDVPFGINPFLYGVSHFASL